jgi:hypothetical protein
VDSSVPPKKRKLSSVHVPSHCNGALPTSALPSGEGVLRNTAAAMNELVVLYSYEVSILTPCGTDLAVIAHVLLLRLSAGA